METLLAVGIWAALVALLIYRPELRPIRRVIPGRREHSGKRVGSEPSINQH
jgi:hypothetical protein